MSTEACITKITTICVRNTSKVYGRLNAFLGNVLGNCYCTRTHDTFDCLKLLSIIEFTRVFIACGMNFIY